VTTVAVPGARWVTRTARRSATFGWPAVVAGAYLVLLVAVAVAAPLVTRYDPYATDLSNVYAGISSAHVLGTDELGRDVASRLIWGARSSLLGPIAVVAAATVLGCATALAAAWIGGRFDTVTTSIVDTVLGFPGILLAILSVALFGAGLTAPVVALTIAYTPYVARVTRSVALRERSLPYVSALTVQGVGGLRVAGRHLIPNMIPIILAQSAILFGYAMVDLAAISFLGLGVQPPTPNWGTMVSVGQLGALAGHPLVAMSAGTVIVLTVIAVNIVGEAVAQRAARTTP
jgi:peptide/nickel transport system permease protein